MKYIPPPTGIFFHNIHILKKDDRTLNGQHGHYIRKDIIHEWKVDMGINVNMVNEGVKQ